RLQASDLLPLCTRQLLLLDLDGVSKRDGRLVLAITAPVPFAFWGTHHEAAGRELAPAVCAVRRDLCMDARFEAWDWIESRNRIRESSTRSSNSSRGVVACCASLKRSAGAGRRSARIRSCAAATVRIGSGWIRPASTRSGQHADHRGGRPTERHSRRLRAGGRGFPRPTLADFVLPIFAPPRSETHPGRSADPSATWEPELRLDRANRSAVEDWC